MCGPKDKTGVSEIERYDYELPRELIAQHPLAKRSDARLMLVDRARQSIGPFLLDKFALTPQAARKPFRVKPGGGTNVSFPLVTPAEVGSVAFKVIAKAGDLARKHGVSEATLYNWKAKYGGMDISEARRLKQLEDENAMLKKLLAEQVLDVAALRELLSKKW